ncbi:MAG TPA: hypothetical protein HPP94_15085 [Desulfuromonadales bacterium]|nr:hypothetical protein [Desulfuromonadales bacterium]
MKTALTTLVIIALTTSLSYGCGGAGCNDRSPQQPEEQSVTGATPQLEQAAPKGKARSMSLEDFAPDGRAAEKDCSSEQSCREIGKPQVEPRSQEKKCSNGNCD